MASRGVQGQPLMTSRSAIEVTLELYELEALIGWHTDPKWRDAYRGGILRGREL